MLHVPAGEGSSISLNANTRGWVLSVTDSKGKALYSTGENYQMLSNLLLSLGFFSEPPLHQESAYQNYLAQLVHFKGCGMQYDSESQESAHVTTNNHQPTRAVVNQRTNPEPPVLTETSLRELLGNTLPWDSIDAVAQAIPEFTHLLSNQAPTESYWIINSQVLAMFNHRGTLCVRVNTSDNIVDQIIAEVRAYEGAIGMIFKGLKIDLEWQIEQQPITKISMRRYLNKKPNHRKHQHHWALEPKLFTPIKSCPIHILINSQGHINVEIGWRFMGIGVPDDHFKIEPDDSLTKEQVTQKFLEHYDSMIGISKVSEEWPNLKCPNKSTRISPNEVENQIIILRETGAITKKEQEHMNTLVVLWTSSWDKKLRAKARKMYGRQTRTQVLIRYMNEHYHSQKNSRSYLPWQWIPEDIVLRGLIAEELGPWLFSHGKIHLLELESPLRI